MRRNVWTVVIILIVIFVGWQLGKPKTPRQPVAQPSVVTNEDKAVQPKALAEPTVSENIRVTSPKPGDVVTSPFIVSGEARVFENQLTVRLSNSTGTALFDQPVTARAKDVGEFGPFKVNMHYQFKNTKEGFVEVFNYSAKDGSIENLVKIPVKF